jgi:hypothetical protein
VIEIYPTFFKGAKEMKKLTSMFFIGLILLFTGCNKIIIPQLDPTPPILRLTVLLNGETIALTSNSGDVTRKVGPNDKISLIATADDMDGGVKEVCITASVSTTCTKDGLGTVIQPLIVPDCNSVNKHIGEETDTKLIKAITLDISDYEKMCTAKGATFTGVKGTVDASAENFHGGKVSTAKFIFTLK